MGRPIGRDLDREMMAKIHALFDRILESVNKENPSYAFDFEQFVDCFDVEDHFTKRVFEFLVKESAQRHRSAHPYQTQQNSLRQQRPPTIHHSRAHTRVIPTIGPAPRSPSALDSPRMRRPHSATVFRHINHPSELDEVYHQYNEMMAGEEGQDDEEETGENSAAAGASAGAGAATAGADADADATTSTLNEPGGSSAPYTSGAALRSMLDARALQVRTQSLSRRSRIAHRMLSYDLMTLDRMNHNRQLLESLLTPPLPSASASASVSVVLSPSLANTSTAIRTTTTTSQTPREVWDSMERAPESFLTRPGSAPPLPSVDSNGSGNGSTFYGLESQEPQHSPGHEWRQQQIRNVYVQQLQARGQRRSLTQELMSQQQETQRQEQELHRTLQTLTGQTTAATTIVTSNSSQDTPRQQTQQGAQAQPQHTQQFSEGEEQPPPPQQQQQRDRPLVRSHENALLLVDTTLSSPATPAPTMANSEPAPLSATTAVAQAVINRPPESSYEEFRSLTRRGREVLRNEYVNELYIEEDAQMLMTGEVSRRRRRRVGGQVMNTNDGQSEDGLTQHPYDIAADNSSTIISQSQQQQQPLVAADTPAPAANSSTDTQLATAPGTGAALSSTIPSGATAVVGGPQTNANLPTTTGLGIPAITLEDSDAVNHDADSSPEGHGPVLDVIPPTPPSPNPNQNARATFTDRRRSSINPADIEAIAREMQLNRNNNYGGVGSNSNNNSFS